MNGRFGELNGILVACIIAGSLAATRVEGQVLTEIHDPLRGVTFHSVELGSRSPDGDAGALSAMRDSMMTIGLSAFRFDESPMVGEYILWLRHDGPGRWLPGSGGLTLTIISGERHIDAMSVHWYASGDATRASALVEKLEYSLDGDDLSAILDGGSAVIRLDTMLGEVSASLTEADIEVLGRFMERISAR